MCKKESSFRGREPRILANDNEYDDCKAEKLSSSLHIRQRQSLHKESDDDMTDGIRIRLVYQWVVFSEASFGKNICSGMRKDKRQIINHLGLILGMRI